MCPSRPPAEGARNIVQDDKGVVYMLVVDPETRILRIPLNYIYPTLAQYRTTMPSLCQLFLNGRCRQGGRCHQVHAVLDVVVELRSQVEHLPVCCAAHGDFDYLNTLDRRSWTSRVLLHVPDALYGGGYIPLSFFSYTIPIGRLLDQWFQDIGSERAVHEGRGQIVLPVGDMTLCRLHVEERCRYAEECNYLHVCRGAASAHRLPLGQRRRPPPRPPTGGAAPGAGASLSSIATIPAALPPSPPQLPLSGRSSGFARWPSLGSPLDSPVSAARREAPADASITTVPGAVRCLGRRVGSGVSTRADFEPRGFAAPPPQAGNTPLRHGSSAIPPSSNLSSDADPNTSVESAAEKRRSTPTNVVVEFSVENGRRRWRYNPYAAAGAFEVNRTDKEEGA